MKIFLIGSSSIHAFIMYVDELAKIIINATNNMYEYNNIIYNINNSPVFLLSSNLHHYQQWISSLHRHAKPAN